MDKRFLGIIILFSFFILMIYIITTPPFKEIHAQYYNEYGEGAEVSGYSDEGYVQAKWVYSGNEKNYVSWSISVSYSYKNLNTPQLTIQLRAKMTAPTSTDYQIIDSATVSITGSTPNPYVLSGQENITYHYNRFQSGDPSEGTYTFHYQVYIELSGIGSYSGQAISVSTGWVDIKDLSIDWQSDFGISQIIWYDATNLLESPDFGTDVTEGLTDGFIGDFYEGGVCGGLIGSDYMYELIFKVSFVGSAQKILEIHLGTDAEQIDDLYMEQATGIYISTDGSSWTYDTDSIEKYLADSGCENYKYATSRVWSGTIYIKIHFETGDKITDVYREVYALEFIFKDTTASWWESPILIWGAILTSLSITIYLIIVLRRRGIL